MHIVIEEHGDLLVVAVEGRLESGLEAAELSRYFSQAFQANRGLIVDLSQCEELGPPACSILVYYASKYKTAQLFLCLIITPEQEGLQQVLASQLFNNFSIFENVDLADAAYAKSPEKQRADNALLRYMAERATDAELRGE
ncbi:MAG: hypothetical protein WCV85_05575 [Patescibacteria group bacterium]|jgi:hypothetical protein